METQKLASMHTVVMKKDELISKLIENKAKHDVVLEAAIQGYWELAESKITQKYKQLNDQVLNWKNEAEAELKKINHKISSKEVLPTHITIRALGIDTGLGLVYPQDHTKDYDKAIRMMEASVYDEVELSAGEFDSYVLNNWEWKENFLNSNSLYISAVKGKSISNLRKSSLTEKYSGQYEAASNSAVLNFTNGGVAVL